MAYYTREVNNYKLNYYNSTSMLWKAQILLYDNHDPTVMLRLYDDPSQAQNEPRYDPDRFSVIAGHIDQLPMYLDILRNEKPLWVTVYDQPNIGCRLQTTYEPVGEEES